MTKDFEYHIRQFAEPNRSTVHFVDWLEKRTDLNHATIVDMACGGGANVLYLAERFPSSHFWGIDYDEDFLALSKIERENAQLEYGNWFDMDSKYIGKFDGVVSFHTLLAFETYQKPLRAVADLKPGWIAMTSLFYEGKINFYIRLEDLERKEDGLWGEDGKRYYNVYSLPLVKEYLETLGYTNFQFQRFDIDVDLPRPETPRMQTYTVPTQDGNKLQISGALLMPWYFIYAERNG